MIREFSVENFLSIRDRQVISFVTEAQESELVSVMPDGTHLNKLGILYGANASGKSNLLKAINVVFSVLVDPQWVANELVEGYEPFVLLRDESVKMGVSFYAEDVRYDYFVEFMRSKILHESLDFYSMGTKQSFYSRDYVGENLQADIAFGDSLNLSDETKKSILENTLNNHSVLSVCLKNSFKDDIKPFTHLHYLVMRDYHEVDGDESRGIVDILKNAYEDEKKRKFFNIMLCKADLNITSYIPVVEKREVSKSLAGKIKSEDFPESLKEKLLNPVRDNIVFVNHSNFGDFDVPLNFQSRGTQKYIRILEALFDMITGNHVYCLDELGEDLHYDLLFYYLNVFLYNSINSQLIITSQETTLLQQDLLNDNRELVWFVEKDTQTASSKYYRGDSYELDKERSLYDAYSIGSLGAKPEVGSFFIDF